MGHAQPPRWAAAGCLGHCLPAVQATCGYIYDRDRHHHERAPALYMCMSKISMSGEGKEGVEAGERKFLVATFTRPPCIYAHAACCPWRVTGKCWLPAAVVGCSFECPRQGNRRSLEKLSSLVRSSWVHQAGVHIESTAH